VITGVYLYSIQNYNKGKNMVSKPRKVLDIIKPQPVLEGAGVRLKRSIATATLNHLDPFLLFDHFGSSNPDDYIKGFPMHPHRGIETVTYMIDGVVNHKDSMGNSGSISGGDVQWMTSGGGIMHEEMPQPCQREMVGFQLWVNLPASLKMTTPRYQNIASEQIPEINREDGVKIRVIAGEVDDPCQRLLFLSSRTGAHSICLCFRGRGCVWCRWPAAR
jgi:redox-sensitive bicupin YhaK (pirin superfamily)